MTPTTRQSQDFRIQPQIEVSLTRQDIDTIMCMALDNKALLLYQFNRQRPLVIFNGDMEQAALQNDLAVAVQPQFAGVWLVERREPVGKKRACNRFL